MRIKIYFITGISIFAIFLITANTLTAQEDTLTIAHEDIFGKLKRPAVNFPHDLHMDVFADQECGVCHHSYDDSSNSLTYEPGDETDCFDCHVAKKSGNIPALREAYHGSCTVCHRRTIKENAGKSGPTTCGECHIK
jgi:hypothetical protein